MTLYFCKQGINKGHRFLKCRSQPRCGAFKWIDLSDEESHEATTTMEEKVTEGGKVKVTVEGNCTFKMNMEGIVSDISALRTIPSIGEAMTDIPYGMESKLGNGIDLAQLHYLGVSMGMAKGDSTFIRLVSAAGIGFFYVERKNPQKMTEKLEFRKYDPWVNCLTLFTEAKMK
ncbi:hypothetical protein IFM89_006790 [Coptis chinensis]|uniref:Uncharacterized protein n=1 Tax=Coptis chinensis TaxID=261450 RepID=A0A835I8N0_9MAGN|nr:hypothetical protein IFM89_006790 [Coptis chinensis]